MDTDLFFVYRAMLCCCWIQIMVPFADLYSYQMLKSLLREHLGGAAKKRW